MRWWVVIVVLLVGCAKKRGLPGAVEQDALWKLAPITATRGIVITSNGLSTLESAWRELHRLPDQVPELAAVADTLRTELPFVFGVREASLANAGMGTKGGAALFYSKSGALFFLPVVDRPAFLAFTAGTTTGDVDIVRDMTCKPIGGRYACAKPRELLGRIGKDTLRDQIERVGLRGDVELAFEEGDSRAGVVATFERGSVLLRGAVRDARLQNVANASAQTFDTTKLAGFGVFNAAPILALLSAPREKLVDNVTLADLLGAIPGPVILSLGPGISQGEMRVPLTSRTLAQTLVTRCEDIAHLAILSSRFRDGACHLRIPSWPVDVAVSADASGLRARIESPPTPAVTLRPSPLATEIARGSWALSMYGRGTALGMELVGNEDIPFESLLGLRLLGLLHEGGFGVRRDGNVLRFVLGLRTVWANPDEVVKKWFSLPTEHLFGRAGLESARTMAATSPTAPLVDDLHAGTAVMFPLAAISFVAGLVSPELFGKDTMRELTSSDSAETITAMSTFTDAMCACKDQACAQRVSNEMSEWSTAKASSGMGPPQFSEGDKVKVTAIGERLGRCMQAALSPTLRADEFIQMHVDLRDRLCTCKDLACGEAVQREMTVWSEAYVKNLPANATMSAAEQSRMAEIESDMRDCMVALRAKK